MVRIWMTMVALAVVSVLSFQNCGGPDAATPAGNQDNLQVEQPGDNQQQNNDNTTDPNQGGGSPATVSSISFGYDANTDAYKYTASLVNGEIKNASDTVVRTLTNDELSQLISFIVGNPLQTGVINQDPNVCDPNMAGKPVFARLNLTSGNPYILNAADFQCGGVDFVMTGTNTRITVDVGGVQMSLQDVLDAYAAELDTM